MDRNVLVMISRLGKKATEGKSPGNRNFLINLCKKSISLLYFIQKAKITIAIIDITMFAMNCLKKESMNRYNGK